MFGERRRTWGGLSAGGLAARVFFLTLHQRELFVHSRHACCSTTRERPPRTGGHAQTRSLTASRAPRSPAASARGLRASRCSAPPPARAAHRTARRVCAAPARAPRTSDLAVNRSQSSAPHHRALHRSPFLLLVKLKEDFEGPLRRRSVAPPFARAAIVNVGVAARTLRAGCRSSAPAHAPQL